MSPYRSSSRDGEPFAVPDPFPFIACLDCGAGTTSMCGEDLCARCDLRWLLRGIDWTLHLFVVRLDGTRGPMRSNRRRGGWGLGWGIGPIWWT